MQFAGLSLVFGMLLGVAQAAPAIPEDARLLGPVRERLRVLVSKTAEEGLPAEMVASKVREGLAKGVPVPRIEAAAVRLAESLAAAHKFVAERRPGAAPPASLLRALAEAHMAGVDFSATDRLVRKGRSPAEVVRAVEVLTDLALRGYPAPRASSVVNEVLARDPRALARVPAALESIRREQALTYTESVDALSRGLASTDSLQSAYDRTVSDQRRRGAGRGGPPADPKDVPPGPARDSVRVPGLDKKQGSPGREGRTGT
jgi:hypothetical protein